MSIPSERLPNFEHPNYSPSTSILDSFKLAIAEQVSTVLSVPLNVAYDGIEPGRPGKGGHCDFMLAVPRFKLQGNSNELAQKLVNEVSPSLLQGRRQRY